MQVGKHHKEVSRENGRQVVFNAINKCAFIHVKKIAQ
jgi:hypothetical protein